MKNALRWHSLAPAVVIGFLTWIAIGGTGFLSLRIAWPSYALAEPIKSYTTPMLFSRLTIGIICTITAGAVAVLIEQRSRVASWWLGFVLLLISGPIHLLWEWADYPPWYHAAYLIPLMPLTILGGLLATPIAAKR